MHAALRSAGALLPRLLLLSLALFCCCSAASATSPVVSVTQTFVNSSCLSFSVVLPADSTAETLRVVVKPQLNNNATDESFPVTLPGPMTIDVNHLRPSSAYTLVFTLESAVNGTSDPVELIEQKTHSLGPQIIALWAQDLTPDDAHPEDADFSNGDQILIAFDSDTNQPPVGSVAQLGQLFAFSVSIGDDYAGQWNSPRELMIQIRDKGQASPVLGAFTVNIIGDIHSPDGLSDQSRSQSPPLTGSWAAYSASNPRWIVPVNKPADDYTSYGVTSYANDEVPLPLSIVFPPGSRTSGYGVAAIVSFPTSTDSIGFLLNANDFNLTQTPAFQIATKKLTNAQLNAAVGTLRLIPRTDYTGYAAVEVGIYDLAATNGAWTMLKSNTYLTVRVDPTPGPEIPSLSVGSDSHSGGLLSNPIEAIKTYRTPLIIGLCVVFGFFLLTGVSICAYRKYRGGRDARDFEGHSLTDDEAAPPMGEGGPSRRFYYDAKV